MKKKKEKKFKTEPEIKIEFLENSNFENEFADLISEVLDSKKSEEAQKVVSKKL